MGRNLCVVEVKPIAGAKSGFKKDVCSLETFTTKYQYHWGILLVFGNAPSAEAVIRSKIGVDFHELRMRRVSVVWIAHAQAELIEF
jgi:hypothetical protein